MKIKTSSLVFRLWSGAAKFFYGAEYPKAVGRANVCNMFWTLVAGWLIVGLFYLFAVVLVPPALAIIYIGWFILALLAGYVPRMSPIGMYKVISACGEGVRPTYGRILGLTLGRFRFYPYHAAIAYLVWLTVSYVIRTTPAVIWERHPVELYLTGTVLLAATALVMAFRVARFIDGPTGKFIKAHLRAKKERVCPRVVFVDDAGALPKVEPPIVTG